METLEGFPNLPALWLRRAKLAYAIVGNRRGLTAFPCSGYGGYRRNASGRSGDGVPVYVIHSWWAARVMATWSMRRAWSFSG